MLLAAGVWLVAQDVAGHLRDLDHDDPDRRATAHAEILKLGAPAVGAVREALGRTGDGELRVRLRDVLLDLDPWTGSKRLATLQDAADGHTAAFNPQLTRVAFVEGETTGLELTPFGATGDFVHSEWVVIGDARQPTYEQIWRAPFWSADGSRLAYIGNRGGTWHASRVVVWLDGGLRHVVVDGREGEGFYAVEDDRVYFSADGSRFAYAAKLPGGVAMVVDGEVGDLFDRVGRPVFSPDGRRLIFTAERDKKHFVVDNGRAGEPLDAVNRLRFSADGGSIGYVVKRDGAWFAVMGDRNERLVGYPWLLEFKPDLSGFVYFLLDRNALYPVAEGARGEGVYDVHGLQFSPDGGSVAYIEELEPGRRRLVVNGERGLESKDLYRFWFAPGGKRIVIFSAALGGSTVEVGGVTVEAVAAYPFADPVFAADGSAFAYLKGNAGSFQLAVGGWISARYDRIGSPVLSPDGRRIMFGAQKGDELWRIVADVN